MAPFCKVGVIICPTLRRGLVNGKNYKGSMERTSFSFRIDYLDRHGNERYAVVNGNDPIEDRADQNRRLQVYLDAFALLGRHVLQVQKLEWIEHAIYDASMRTRAEAGHGVNVVKLFQAPQKKPKAA